MRKDLQYQADEQFMMHETAVLSVAVSLTSELLASGSQDGKIKVGPQWLLPFMIPEMSGSARHSHLEKHFLLFPGASKPVLPKSGLMLASISSHSVV